MCEQACSFRSTTARSADTVDVVEDLETLVVPPDLPDEE